MDEVMEAAEALVRLGEGPAIVKEGWLLKRAEYFKNWRWRLVLLPPLS